MRLGKMMLLALSVVLVSNTLSACNFLRTPYERQKINENGGVAKKASDEGSDAGGGGKGEGGKGATGGPKDGKAEIKKKEDREKASHDRAETKGERKERMKGQGVLYYAPKTLKDETPKLSYEPKLSAAVSQLEGVGGATVLLDDDHHAYVAISNDPQAKRKEEGAPAGVNTKYNVKTEGDIPATVQERIALKLRSIDAKIGRVNITDDPHHVDTVHRYAVKAADGSADDLNTQALAEHIEDIWK